MYRAVGKVLEGPLRNGCNNVTKDVIFFGSSQPEETS